MRRNTPKDERLQRAHRSTPSISIDGGASCKTGDESIRWATWARWIITRCTFHGFLQDHGTPMAVGENSVSGAVAGIAVVLGGSRSEVRHRTRGHRRMIIATRPARDLGFSLQQLVLTCMNRWGHEFPNYGGHQAEGLDEKLRPLLSCLQTMGHTGMDMVEKGTHRGRGVHDDEKYHLRLKGLPGAARAAYILQGGSMRRLDQSA